MDAGDAERRLVFDLGGVLFDWDPRHLYRRHLPEDELEAFIAECFHEPWFVEMDEGRPIAEAVEALADRFPRRADLIRRYADEWRHTIAGTLPGTPDLLDDLVAAGHRLVALSNWPRESFAWVRERHPELDRWFDDLVLSHDVGIAKPKPGIYAAAERRVHVSPERIVFVDDRPANCEPARARGWTVIRFESADQTRRRLSELGFLDPTGV